jgi:hypothetical protein
VALAHNLAEQAKIAPAVTIDVISGKDTSNGSRPAMGAKRPICTRKASEHSKWQRELRPISALR